MTSVNPSRSMGNFKRYCSDKATSLNEFITMVKDRIPTPKEVSELEELYAELKDQFKRMHAKWKIFSEEIEDDGVYKKYGTDYNEAKVIVDRQRKAAEAILKEAPSADTSQRNTTGGSSVKIDDMLKPKELLLRSMTLEEADQCRAFLKHNEKALSRQDISVIRALLNNSIEAGLSSALRADAKIQATTPIAEKDGCLDTLRAKFLEKNPLWLRRHHYFKCQQQKSETVNDW